MAERQARNKGIAITSHSRLEAFNKCAAYYKYKYIEKAEYKEEFNSSFFLGTIVHELIEMYLEKGYPAHETFCNMLTSYLAGIEIECRDTTELEFLLGKIAKLYYRCSPHCKEPEDQIRTSSGGLLKDPVNYPSSSFKKAVQEEKLWPLIIKYDTMFREQRPDVTNLVWILGNALYLGNSFRTPKWIKRTIGVEIPISTNEENKVKLDGTNVHLNGYIDWVVETEQGIGIIDHKTSTSKPTGLEVLYSVQLNLYAWAYKEIYGVPVKYIGINHIKSGEIILAEVEEPTTRLIVNYIEEIQKSIENSKYFPKKSITQYNSPCYKKDFKSGRVSELCPFAGECWPGYEDILDQL